MVVSESSADDPNPLDGLKVPRCFSQTSAVSEDEEETAFFYALRQEMQQNLAHCRPYWLIAGHQLAQILTEGYAAAIIGKYSELSQRVHCSNREDKLRSLCPMIAHIPVEGQQELLSLIRQINAIAPRGMSLDRTGTALLAPSLTTISSDDKAVRGQCSKEAIDVYDGITMNDDDDRNEKETTSVEIRENLQAPEPWEV